MHVILWLVLPMTAFAGKKKDPPMPAPAAAASVTLPCPYVPGTTVTWTMAQTGSESATGTVSLTTVPSSTAARELELRSTIQRPPTLMTAVMSEAVALADVPARLSFDPQTRTLQHLDAVALRDAVRAPLDLLIAQRPDDAPPAMIDYLHQMAANPGYLTSVVLRGRAPLLLVTCGQTPLGETRYATQMPSPMGSGVVTGTGRAQASVAGDLLTLEVEERMDEAAFGQIMDDMVTAGLLEPALRAELAQVRMWTEMKATVSLSTGLPMRVEVVEAVEAPGRSDPADRVVFTLAP